MKSFRFILMIVIIIMSFMYILGLTEIKPETNYALTLAAVIFSASSSLDTFFTINKLEQCARYILDTIGLLAIVVLPNLSNAVWLERIMKVIDNNILLLLALFFMLLNQWASEIKIKDIINHVKKEK